MTLKIDLKVKLIKLGRWPPLSWTSFVWTIFLYLSYRRRNLGGSRKMAHRVCM